MSRKNPSDTYENGEESNILNLIHTLSKSPIISIKIAVGVMEETNIVDILMQGETVSIICFIYG